MSRRRKIVLTVVVLLVAYFLAWPTPVDPVAWKAPRAPAVVANRRLFAVEWLLRGRVRGPEAIAFDAAGQLYTGLADGRIVRLGPGGLPETFASTGGRPLGLKFDARGNLVVADAKRGLLSIDPAGAVTELAVFHEGKRFQFVDDLDIAKDGTIYFTDASTRFGLDDFMNDIVEHRPTGRLLAYHPDTRTTEVVASGLMFANGVALAPGDDYAVVCETASYRLLKVLLNGTSRGKKDVLVDNLPGFPDNVTYSASRDAFWVALPAPRNAMLDKLSGRPFLRKVLSRLPRFLQPKPKRHGMILAVDPAGRVIADLQDPSHTSYAPVTSVLERDGQLWLGSYQREAIGRIAAP